MRETREAAIREAQDNYLREKTGYETKLAELQRQRDALLGVQPPEDPSIAAIRNQFSQLFPRLAKFEERGIDPERIMAMLDRAGDLELQNKHYWDSFGQQQMTRLVEKAQGALGGTALSQAARAHLHAAFSGWVQSSPELVDRYATDPSIVDEFWNAFTSHFIEPARRAAATSAVGRTNAALPRDSVGSTPRITPAPGPQSIDERLNSAWAQYQATAKP